jgi:hypothetical protein
LLFGLPADAGGSGAAVGTGADIAASDKGLDGAAGGFSDSFEHATTSPMTAAKTSLPSAIRGRMSNSSRPLRPRRMMKAPAGRVERAEARP